jgi:hypothetical protein
MAKEPRKKPRFYTLIAQAYRATAPHDKALLPLMLVTGLGLLALGVGIGLILGSLPAIIYGSLFGLTFAVLGTLFVLTKRFEKTAFAQMEGSVGGSVAVAQSIRNGWQFQEAPEAVDNKGRAVVFRGVGKSGVVLLAEGGTPSRKLVDATTRRYAKLLPGVPVRPIYVGRGTGEVPMTKLVREIKKGKKVLSRREREAVAQRLQAMGGARLPVPKGVDPLRARPDRKAMRGR